MEEDFGLTLWSMDTQAFRLHWRGRMTWVHTLWIGPMTAVGVLLETRCGPGIGSDFVQRITVETITTSSAHFLPRQFQSFSQSPRVPSSTKTRESNSFYYRR